MSSLGVTRGYSRNVATVSSIRIHHLSTPLVRPFVTAARRADVLDSIVVEVRDSDGRSGWGEAPTSWRVTGESAAGVTAVVEQALAPAITGMPTDDPAAISRALCAAVVGNNAARMAVDCACYDAAAQAADQPLWRYLGAASGEVTTDMTLSVESDTAALVQRAREHVATGFRTLKVKVGVHGPSADQLAAIRDAVGDRVRLRVDANQAWTGAEARAAIAAFHDRAVGLEFVEQPVHRDDVDALVDVAATADVPVLADESVWTRRQLREVLAVGRVAAVNVKLAKTGGILEALALARAAREAGVGVIVGCMLESQVGISSGAAVAAALRDGAADSPAAQDLDGGCWLADSPVVGGVVSDGPRLTLPDEPGLGIHGIR